MEGISWVMVIEVMPLLTGQPVGRRGHMSRVTAGGWRKLRGPRPFTCTCTCPPLTNSPIVIKINYFYTRTPLNNINAPQMIKLHIMYATLQGLLDSISAVMVTGFPTLGGSGLTVRLLTLKILLEPMINFIKGKNLNQAI